MKNKKQQNILVLTDLKENSKNVLKSAASMAQMIDATIELFHVKPARKVVTFENQLSAARSIKENYVAVEKQLHSLATEIKQSHNVTITCAIAFGNVKNEIKNQIEKSAPKMIVIGKKTSKKPTYFGDKIAAFVVKNFDGQVVVADHTNVITPDQTLSLGLIDVPTTSEMSEVADTFIKRAEKPLRSFIIADKNEVALNESSAKEDVIQYVFERNDNAVKNISKYVAKSGIDMLCIEKPVNKDGVNFNDIVNQVGASILISKN